MKTNCTLFVLLAITLCIASTAYSKTITYDFKDPKGVNAVSIIVDSKLEPNVGAADSISGTITIDHAAKKILKGSLTIPTEKVIMTNSMMTKVLHSKEWLNKKKNPTITFVFDKIISIANMSDNEFDLAVKGNLTIKGVTQTITAPVKLSFHPGALGIRNKEAQGDIAILRTAFEINRFDFKIKPDMPEEIVGKMITLTLNIAGGAAM